MRIVINLDGDGMVEWLKANTNVAVDGELNYVSGNLTDVLDAVIHNTSAVIEEDDD